MAKWIKIRDAQIVEEPCHTLWVNMDNVSFVDPDERTLETTDCSTIRMCSDYDWNKIENFLRNNEAL